VRRGAALGLGAVRLAIATAIIFGIAYVLSWQILWEGMAGSEAPFHLHLIDWVATTYPNLPWWYPWDGMGVSYREAYPLASHWLAVAASHVFATSLEGGAQVIQFALMPLTAVGLYAFFHWRLGRPLAGLAAALLFMLSPIGWVEWTHFGLYASWVGMVFFMPALIALDTFFFAWLAGDRGWRFRAAAASYVVMTTILGTVSPHLLAAPLIAALAYALALPRSAAGRSWRWLFAAVPSLFAGVLLLSAFWVVAEIQYLAVVRSHWAGAGTNFDFGRLTPIDLGSLLSLHPLEDGSLGDLYSFTPAVLLPALLGATLIGRYGRARLLVGLSVCGITLMTFRDLYRPLFAIPGFSEFAVVAHRPLLLVAALAVPALAALGLFEMPAIVVALASRRWRWPGRARVALGLAVPVVMTMVLVSDVYAFAGRVEPSGRLAYGPSVYGAPALGDIWQYHAPAIACRLECPAKHQLLVQLGATFPLPPDRAELNSGVAQLDMAFHTLVGGGGITHSYNDQVIPSRELASWMEDSMLVKPGTTTKSQLADALGIDAVVLSPAQADRAADYRQLGWIQVSAQPLAFVDPHPSGLAAQWAGGTAVLVVGQTQTGVPSLYNFVFERATAGLLPFASAWLVRGPSPDIDDYSDAELSHYSGVVLLGYRYHDQGTAWSRLDRYVRGGGHLFVETGWQYVDPDWNVGSAPATLPVNSVRWGSLDPSASTTVDGTADAQFGRFVYGTGGWGASSAGSVRPGATELVKVGDRVVVARWQLGAGRVVWSGMNLLAHDASSGSNDEDQFVSAQLSWLFAPAGGAGAQVAIPPIWDGGEHLSLALNESSGPSLVLLKESLFPGWSARLVTPSGSEPVGLVGSEMDFMLATLGPVPAGSKLVFTYGPTPTEVVSWFLAGAFLIALLLWVIRPAVYARGARAAGAARRRMTSRLADRFAEDEQPRGEDP
jgi:hypothetical protein